MTPIHFGNYLLLERLDAEGVCEVFKAKAFGAEGFERLVLVKRLLPSLTDDRALANSLLRETEASLRLSHPNLVEVVDVGILDGVFFVATEYVPGRRLHEVLDRRVATGLPVAPDIACFLGSKLAAGLACAHGYRSPEGQLESLVHGGLSPRDVLISRAGQVRVANFGFGVVEHQLGRAHPGSLRSKFAYAAPEQVQGADPDPRSDVFSAGVCLYELLTGSRLFLAESEFVTLENVRSAAVEAPSGKVPDIPKELDDLVLAALARAPEDRIGTAGELQERLERYLAVHAPQCSEGHLARFLESLFGAEIEREAEHDEELLQAPWNAVPVGNEETKEAVIPEARGLGQEEVSEVESELPRLPLAAWRERHARRVQNVQGGAVDGASHARQDAAQVSAGVLQRERSAPAVGARWEEDDLATEVFPGAESEERLQESGMSAPVPGTGPVRSKAAPRMLSLAGPPSKPAPPPSYASPRLPPPARLPRRTGSDRAGNPSPFEGEHPSASRRRPRLWGQRGGKPSRYSAWLQGGAWLLLGVLVASGLLYLTRADKPEPGKLVVSTRPAEARVLFDEKPIASRGASSPFVIENVDTSRGHLIEVQHPGYRTELEWVKIEPGETHLMPLIELKREGRGTYASGGVGTGFRLTTDPEGARVYLDGEELTGRTPLEVRDLAPGTYRIRVERGQRYVPWERRIEVHEGKVKALPVVKLPVRAATVKFRSQPSGATVTLVRDGEQRVLGRTPASADVEIVGAPWTVEITHDGYAPWTSELVAPDGREEFEVTALLVPAAREPRGEARPAAAARGRISRGTAAGRRAAASRERQGRRAPSTSQRSSVPDGAMGTLQINAVPWAQVYVDGRLVGNTPQMNLSLTPGIHAVMLVNPDFGIQKSIAVEVRAGQTVRRVVRLPMGE